MTQKGKPLHSLHSRQIGLYEEHLGSLRLWVSVTVDRWQKIDKITSMVFVRCCLKYLSIYVSEKGNTLTSRVNLLTSESWGCYVQADPNLESLVQQTHLESATNSPWRRRILWFSMRFSMSGEIHAGSDAATSRSGPASPVRLRSIENSKKAIVRH